METHKKNKMDNEMETAVDRVKTGFYIYIYIYMSCSLNSLKGDI